MSKVTIGIILTLMVLGLLPFALIARSRASQSDNLPPHLVLDMDKQPKAKAQRATPWWHDQLVRSAMPVSGRSAASSEPSQEPGDMTSMPRSDAPSVSSRWRNRSRNG